MNYIIAKYYLLCNVKQGQKKCALQLSHTKLELIRSLAPMANNFQAHIFMSS